MAQLHDVAVSVRRTPVLRGLNLRLAAGEVLGVLGANGSGKTTLLQVLATLVAPAGGRGQVLGHELSGPGVGAGATADRAGRAPPRPVRLSDVGREPAVRRPAHRQFSSCLQGDFSPAMRHYLDALRREPDNAEARAHLGWLLLQISRPQDALESTDRALALDPSLDDALWFRWVFE